MDVRNRLADVTKLRCNVCQDFIKMILKKDWKQQLYNKASSEVSGKTKSKEKYEHVFEQMREKGVEAYRVDDMDVTLITELVASNFAGFFSTEPKTRSALYQLKNDRNIKSHSGENEEPGELYLHGLLALYNIKNFIITVDKYEVCIDENERLAFKQEYIAKTEALMETLDEERIELIQRKKDMDRDIQTVLNSRKPSRMWCDMIESYAKRFLLPGGDTQRFYDFFIHASDSGVPYAHSHAADYFRRNKDYNEAVQRWLMLFDSKTEIYISDVNDMISMINEYIEMGNSATKGMLEIISKLQEKDFNIIENGDGFYQFIR